LSKTVKHNIQELADELKTFNRNDVLVHFADKDPFDLEAGQSTILLKNEGEIAKTYKKAQTVFRESGTSVFCISKGILKWEWNGALCESPIFLFPATIRLDKIKNNFSLSWENSEGFLNPFLLFYFQKEYDFSWPIVDFDLPNWEELHKILAQKGFDFSIESNAHFGNFHHHRFSILRELEMLVGIENYSSVLKHIFNVKEDKSSFVLPKETRNLFPADMNQLSVFDAVLKEDVVVHGPPGTGKSQVLSNILGKNLIGNTKTLVVSEKRVALEVLQQKMESLGLDRFLFLQGANANSQILLDQLQETWQFLESYIPKKEKNIPLSEMKLDGLQFKLNVLSEPNRIGGISYAQFLEMTKGEKLEGIQYSSNAPLITEWLTNSETLHRLYKEDIQFLTNMLPQNVLRSDSFFQMDEKMKRLEEEWKVLNTTISFSTKLELKQALHRAIVAQVMVNEIQQDYFSILDPNGSDKKKFTRWSKKYFVLKKELENLVENNDHWNERPTLDETNQLLLEIKSAGFFQKLKTNKYLKKALKSTFVPVEKALLDNQVFLQKQADFREIEKKLTEIGVKTETEIHWIKGLCAKLNSEDWALWQTSTPEENKALADLNSALNQFYQNTRTYLKLKDDTLFETLFEAFKIHYSTVLSHRKELVAFSASLYTLFGETASMQEMEQIILKSNWVRFVEQFPAFNDFELNQLSTDLEEIIANEEKEFIDFSEAIMAKQKAKFDALNTLLQTPARKLSDSEKSRKTSLRKGRSLLVKEFGKSRSHPTIRELLQSDAREWIYALLPIWMVNSAQVGDFFPLEEELFDLALFDEATQIPLRNALGSLHRAKRALILGDEHQMSPTSYFKSGDSEPIDLLHQARFNWPKIMLKHHYRSQHAELIAFSNQHFYNNELIAYPSANRDGNPVEIHFVANGKYEEQINIVEAKEIAQHISKALENSTQSLGIVAFSEKQLKCIWGQLSAKDQQKLDSRLDENTAFFRALENVQGEECDHLLVSLGYGKNDEEKLNLNFGPLNRKSGARRLNVLLSRAKQKIDFFTSIQANDLAISDNDSLNLLRQFLQMNNSLDRDFEIHFPLNLHVKSLEKTTSKTSIQFDNLLETLSESKELLTFYRVLQQRGWELKF
jgi:hypothetical protein